MHAAGWIEVRVIWHGSDDDPATLHFGDVVSEGPGHRVERQGSVDEALDKLQAAHRFLLLLADPSVAFPCNAYGHSRPASSAFIVLDNLADDDNQPGGDPYPHVEPFALVAPARVGAYRADR